MKSLFIFTNGLFIRVILRAFQLKMSKTRSFYISILSTIGNFLTPFRGGAGLRAIYLKRKYNFSYSNFLATFAGMYIISLFVVSLLALLSLLSIHTRTGEYTVSIYIFFLAILIGSALPSIIKLPSWKIFKNTEKNIFHKVIESFQRVLKGWKTISKNRTLLIKLTIITFGNIILSLFTSYFEFNAVHVPISIDNLLLYVCLSSTSLFISLTPGSVGIKEGIILLTSGIIGITNEQVIQVAVIDRGIQFLNLIMLYLLIIRIKKHYR